MVQWLAQERQNVQIIWDPEAREHTFLLSYHEWFARTQHQSSLKIGFNFASALGVAGVALWELGQIMTMLLDVF